MDNYEIGPIIDVNSIQAKIWPEIANTHCWLSKAPRCYTEPRQYIQMWVYHFEEIPNDELNRKMHVMHKCDNLYGECCNPLHLKLGTNKDNAKDCSLKKRNLDGVRALAVRRKARGDVFCTPEAAKKAVETKRKNGGRGI